ncbi:MAG: cob(I)yrinic acid a,c-diamide adenosyltransferase [Fimbriimonadaceae bacterium]|nr:cob(I)yrinic acid a,c-diamide adenosyltransferase [Fimbriimonadaceae bacterium]
MKIYTRTGDDGTTGLVGGSRALKSDPRIELLGDLDEVNSHLGVLRSLAIPARLDLLLGKVQSRIFETGSEVASVPEGRRGYEAALGTIIEDLEASIDDMEASLEPLRQFILPGGGPAGAQAHLARTVCRRAERSMVALAGSAQVRTDLLRFLNRLSDWLFVAARWLNRETGCEEVAWAKEENEP